MPIRTVPWDELSEQHVRELIDREIRESRTLDYKGKLELTDSGKLDLLEDVTAMANAAGGTILYGAVEGKGDDKGLIVRIEPMILNKDDTELTIANLLRDGVEERIHQVLHQALPVEDGGYLYIIRVPPSPRAPHMVTRKSTRDRFFLRTNSSKEPMRVQQIRESVLRSDTAVERAKHFLDERTSDARRLVTSQPPRPREGPVEFENSMALMHFVPLFQPANAIDLGDRALVDRMRTVQGFGAQYPGNLRWTLEGLYNQYSRDEVHRNKWVLLTRDGEVEFGERPFLYPTSHLDSNVPTLDVLALDAEVRKCVDQARALSEAGLFAPPFVMSLRFLYIHGSVLTWHRNYGFLSPARWSDDDLLVPAEVVTDWGESLESALRRISHTIWQAFGFQRCNLYNEDGSRRDLSQG